MPDLTSPLVATALFVSVGWLIVNAGRQYDDAIGHTLKVFALVLGLLVMAGLTATLRVGLGLGRTSHRLEAHSQDEPAGKGRAAPRLRQDP